MFRLSRWLSRSYRRAIEANIAPDPPVRTCRPARSGLGVRSSCSSGRHASPSTRSTGRRGSTARSSQIVYARPAAIVHVSRDRRLGESAWRRAEILRCPVSPTPVSTRRRRAVMGYRTLAECVDDLRRHGQLVRSTPRSTRTSKPRRSSAGSTRPRARPCSSARQGDAVPDGRQPVRHARADAVPVPRHARRRPPPRRAEGRPARALQAPLALSRRAVRRRCTCCRRRVRAGPILAHDDDARPAAAAPVAGRATAGRSSRCRRSTPRTPTGPAGGSRTWACTASSSRATSTSRTARSGCTTRSTAASASTTRRRSGAGEPLRVNVFVGGPPALTLAAVMPLPEGLPELSVRRRARRAGGVRDGRARRRPADPRRRRFLHRRHGRSRRAASPKGRSAITSAITAWRTTSRCCASSTSITARARSGRSPSVGRPPQEDTSFGELIHELTGPIIPTVIPGVHAVHAVDAAGVHPLLLAIGSERYVPYADGRTAAGAAHAANAILGQGQLSLAKYLLIVAREDDPALDIHDIAGVLPPPARAGRLDERPALPDPHDDRHARLLGPRPEPGLEGRDRRGRADAARRCRPSSRPACACRTASDAPRVVPAGRPRRRRDRPIATATPAIAPVLRRRFAPDDPIHGFPLIVLVDDSEFTARTLNNFLWVTFTRSNPAADIHGIGAFIAQKHWGCTGPLVIDARIKPHHAPPLVEDPEVERRVDAPRGTGRAVAWDHLRRTGSRILGAWNGDWTGNSGLSRRPTGRPSAA